MHHQARLHGSSRMVFQVKFSPVESADPPELPLLTNTASLPLKSVTTLPWSTRAMMVFVVTTELDRIPLHSMDLQYQLQRQESSRIRTRPFSGLAVQPNPQVPSHQPRPVSFPRQRRRLFRLRFQVKRRPFFALPLTTRSR